jgi:glycosyltransferase involved in cell wall biosynthesis
MAPAPLVSIIIPTYNHAHYLGEAIESALAQEGPPAEIIVVDDGSRDHPEQVVSRYPGVRLIRQNNAGLAAARNTGWRHADGRYVVFLDADDRLVVGALASNLHLLEAHPAAGFVYGRYRFIGPDGSPRKQAYFAEVAADPFAAFLRGNIIGMHATVTYRREALERAGGFDAGLRACEDYDLYLRLSRHVSVACHQALIADYRMHGTNMSRNNPFMLHWALTVLGRQKQAARERPAWMTAYLEGVRNWKRHYAVRQLGRVWTAPDAQSLLDLARLAVRAPGTVMRVGSGALLRRVPGPIER